LPATWLADAGSIEQHGIELAAILAAGIAGGDQVKLLRFIAGRGVIRTVPHGFAPVVRR
jgi:hypothetical protein